MSAVAGIGLLALLYFATQSDAQLPFIGKKKETAVSIFVQATEEYRKGEYEKAKVFFDKVDARKNELTPAQQRDLERWIQFNNLALAGRQAYENTLRKAETAKKEAEAAQKDNRVDDFKRNIDEIKKCIKELDPNPYGSPNQRERLRQLVCFINGCVAPMDWRQILKSAQIAFKSGDLDTAELMARDSIAQRPWIHPFTGDTPEKLLDQIREARERVHPPERKDGFFGPVKNLLFGKETTPTPPPVNPNEKPRIVDYPNDGPRQIPGQPTPMPDQQQQPPMQQQYPPQQTPMYPPPQVSVQPYPQQPLPLPPTYPQPQPTPPQPWQTPPMPPQPAPMQPLPLPPLPLPPAPPMPPQSNNLAPPSTTTAVRMSDRDLPPPSTVSDIQQASFNMPGLEDEKTAEKHRQALILLRDAQNLMTIGDLAEAYRKAKLAKDMAKDVGFRFLPTEPQPDQLLQQIYRMQQGAQVAATGQPADSRPPPSPATRPQDPKVLVKQARDLIKKEQYDEAQRLIALASEARPHGWGLFEDSPEKLQRDLNRLRTNRDRERANELMKQALKLYKGGQIADAKSLAQQALALHGPYGYFDKGDRPQQLLDEIYRLEQRQGTESVSLKQDIKGDDSRAAPIASGPDAEKRKRADALVAEALTLRSQGKLVEARAKTIEAMSLNVIYGPNEQTPNNLLAALGSECNDLLNKMCQEGLDQANKVSDPDRFQKALGILENARNLCRIFGQDPQPIEIRMGYVMQQQGQAPPPQPRFTAMQQQGLDLLNQARVEIRNGELPVARRLIMEAMDRKFDVEMQAMWVLKSLESIERQRDADIVNANALAGIQAFNKKDYRKAAQILKDIKVDLVNPNYLTTVREILADPEMRPSKLAKEPFAGERDPAPLLRTDPTKPPAGMASVGDMPKGSDVDTARKLEKVQFDWLRSQSIVVQQNAIEVCKVDPAQAITMLEGFLEKLNATSFDVNDKEALMKPIEIRINQYKRIQNEQVFLKAQQQNARPAPYESNGQDREEKRKELLAQTQQEVAQLVKDAGELMKKGKYEEAKQKYELSHQLLPDAMAPIQGIEAMKILIRERDWKRDTANNEKMFEGYMGHGLYGSTAPSPGQYMTYAPGHSDKSRYDGSAGLSGLTKSQAELLIESRLREPISVSFRDTGLQEAVFALKARTGLNIVIDLDALQTAGVRLDARVTLQLEEVALKSILEILLKQVRLTYIVKSDVLQITTESASHGNLVQRVYNITDLVVPIPDYPTSTFNDLHDAFRRHMGGTMGLMSSQASPMTPNLGLPPGTPVGSTYPGTGGPIAGQPAGFHGGDPSTGHAMSEQLVSLIQDMVAQPTWASCGGHGMIKTFPLGNALIVNQTEDVHAGIANLLANLRKMQEVQVAIEMRVITLSDQWYDLVNMNFEIGNTSAFAKGPGMIAGVAPAGTAPDMSIPFRSIVSAFGAPPFAGQNGFLAGSGSIAIGAGFSFLNEIQVHMFMEAARGDKRTQTLANPNVTVLNGATANIALNKYKFFNTGATPIQNGAQVFFMPQNNPFPVGINMQVTPIVSSDRRFVRLHLVPNITNLVSSNPPTTVEVPIPQLFEGRGNEPGRSSFVKMILQQPEFETVSLNTTVNVPDGGTVVLGGLKTLAEVRVETGPPVLRAVPGLNRFFRNSNYTRETRNLIIMVTPHIIINEAEYQVPQEQGPLSPTAFRR
jgi:type II secretory pathway component GspD/PulD (secretin)